MPYIEQEDRPKIDAFVDPLSEVVETEGELNYAITRLTHRIIDRRGLCYATLNMLLGVLVGVLLELYLMKASPYEQEKREANGDI